MDTRRNGSIIIPRILFSIFSVLCVVCWVVVVLRCVLDYGILIVSVGLLLKKLIR